MHKVVFNILTLVFITGTALSQKVDRVSELISAEDYFAALVKEKGIKDAFLAVSDENTIVFKSDGALNARKYYKKQPDSLGTISWEPVFARMAKSGDWGFTTGPYVAEPSGEIKTIRYGDYLSIWKKNLKGRWKLALDIGAPHQKPKTKPAPVFQNAKNEIYLKQRSKNRLQQREDVVYSSDRLMGTTLKTDDQIAFKEFIGKDCRLIFPGFEPIKGKDAIMNFWKKHAFNLSSDPIKADRSYSGELAYTYGNATVVRKGEGSQKYNYVRVWEVQEGYVWNVILEIYSEVKEAAEEKVE